MLRGDVPQPSRAHRARTEHDLARAAVERLQELDHLAHGLARERAEAQHRAQVVGRELEHRERRADREERRALDIERLLALLGKRTSPVS